MNDDSVLWGKLRTIGRCLNRIREEYQGHEAELETNLTRQDAIVLNLQRACEAVIDAAAHVVRLRRLGPPQSARDLFDLLYEAHLIDRATRGHMQGMVGFRNIAVHDYRAIDLAILRGIVENRLDDLTAFAKSMLALDLKG
ncbi:MAG: DUF86 domain-containing protein [Geminicoccaceae bacterium]|nr:DUF86 domain-containing protein [Geminicoccaceae bacterium]